MTTKRFLFVLVGVLVLVNILALAAVWMKWNRPGAGGRAGMAPGTAVAELLRRELGWSDDQLARYDEARALLKEQTQPVLRDIHEMKREMFEAAAGPTPDLEEIETITAEIGAKQALMEMYAARHVMELNRICGDDQQEHLRRFLHELMEMGRPEGMERPAHPPRDGQRRPPRDGQHQPPPRPR